MQILNLKKDFAPLGPGTLEDVSKPFPSGFEPNVRIRGNFLDSQVIVTTRIEKPIDFLNLNLAIDALSLGWNCKVGVFIPFFPCSRQDRLCHPGESQSFRLLASMLKNSGAVKILTFDLHSEKVGEDNAVHSVSPLLFQKKVLLGAKGPSVILYPDEGAANRYRGLHSSIPNLLCQKSRVDGSVYSVDIPDFDFSKKTVYVIDDICDGGATFTEIAEKINKKNKYVNLELVVSHGLFSRGLADLKAAGYQKIHTTDSYFGLFSSYPQVEVHPLYGIMREDWMTARFKGGIGW